MEGNSWVKITKGLPGQNMGKIGLAISPMQPNVLYAAIELERKKALYIELIIQVEAGLKCLMQFLVEQDLITTKSL